MHMIISDMQIRCSETFINSTYWWCFMNEWMMHEWWMNIYLKVKVTWSITSLGICAPHFCWEMAFNPSKVHTHSSEHTPGAVGSHLCCSARGGSVPCSRAPQSWYWGWRESAVQSLSRHLQFLPARVSNSQPLDYQSDFLTIRPRLPHVLHICSYVPGLQFICCWLEFSFPFLLNQPKSTKCGLVLSMCAWEREVYEMH